MTLEGRDTPALTLPPVESSIFDMSQILAIAIFGLIGILSRYGIDRTFAPLTSDFPWNTLTINVLGSAVAGVVFVLGEKSSISPALQAGLIVGFCGGFTTFSAYALQSVTMIQEGRAGVALAYVLGSQVVGFGAVYAAIVATRKFV